MAFATIAKAILVFINQRLGSGVSIGRLFLPLISKKLFALLSKMR